MLSSAARSFVRSTTSATARSTSSVSRPLASASFGGSHHQQHQEALVSLTSGDPRIAAVPSNNHPPTRRIHPILFQQQQQHFAAPVFVGFAVPSSQPQPQEPQQNIPLDTTLRMIWAAAEDHHQDNNSDGVLEMKRNRNNRPAKRANKGKRPCNRNARRKKLIKIGRRSRS